MMLMMPVVCMGTNEVVEGPWRGPSLSITRWSSQDHGSRPLPRILARNVRNAPDNDAYEDNGFGVAKDFLHRSLDYF